MADGLTLNRSIIGDSHASYIVLTKFQNSSEYSPYFTWKFTLTVDLTLKALSAIAVSM